MIHFCLSGPLFNSINCVDCVTLCYVKAVVTFSVVLIALFIHTDNLSLSCKTTRHLNLVGYASS
jgi:hypothetical protein